MKRIVEFPLDGGGSVLVEVDEPEHGGTVRAARPGEVAEMAEKSFQQALGTIGPAAEIILAKLGDLSEPPDQAVVEFGVKLSGTLNAVIASAVSEANFKVALTWKRNDQAAKR
jgi:hypothetical protein